MSKIVLSEIYIYPIKSLKGIRLPEAKIDPTGLQHDRRWMLTDENNRFFTQRKLPGMALFNVSINKSTLMVTHSDDLKDSLKIPINASTEIMKKVVIWNDECDAVVVSEEANQWFSRKLGLRCQLVYMPDTTKRIVDQRYANNNEIVSFADGYPFLIIGQASLDDLNSRLEEKVLINRFRPNFVFKGGIPYIEDRFKRFAIGNTIFYGSKSCTRCVLTTIDPETGIKGKEPLYTLSKYRKKDQKILFGKNLTHKGVGMVKERDEINILEWWEETIHSNDK